MGKKDPKKIGCAKHSVLALASEIMLLQTRPICDLADEKNSINHRIVRVDALNPRQKGGEGGRRRKPEDLAPVQMQKCIFKRINIAIKLTPLILITIVMVHKRTRCFKPLLKSKNVFATFPSTI